ncbi:hypothetical protein D9M71_398710 [compost metagenome]
MMEFFVFIMLVVIGGAQVFVGRSARLLLKNNFPDKYRELVGGQFDGLFDNGARLRVSSFLLFGDVKSLGSDELLSGCRWLKIISALYVFVFLLLVFLFFKVMGR